MLSGVVWDSSHPINAPFDDKKITPSPPITISTMQLKLVESNMKDNNSPPPKLIYIAIIINACMKKGC